ncbi:hypothetical protein DFJ73DRAFT_854114 [Zopfochytrium polystomum]|nr:hypothetical protein DFJ73DRAFT_854114 [Zopfochytrium polystomum]
MFTTGGVQPQEILTPALAAARRQLVDRAWSRLLALSDAVKVPLVQRRSPRQELAFLSRKAVSGCSAGTTVEVDLEAGMAAVIIEVEGSGDKQHQQQTPMTRSSAGDLVDEGELYAAVRAGLEVDAGSSRPTATDPFTEFWSSQSNGSRQNTLSIEECRIVFSELHPSFRHYGLDNSWVDGADAFLEAHLELGCNVVQSKSASSAAEYARLGIPPHLRSKLWFTLTQSEFTVNEEGYSEDLCRFLRGQVAKYELLTDRLILQEVKKCQDDDTYFVFEEMARDILLLWSRDESIASQYGEQLTGSMEDDVRPVSTGMRGRWSSEIKWFPPNGRLPMCGLSSYATLTSFLHSNLDTAYGLFRNLYLKYFQHMQTVTAHHCSITALHAMFETLLKQLDPLLFLHLAHKVAVGTSCRESLSTPSTPTSKSTWTAGAAFRPAFKWIVHGFVGTLDVEEVLLLWDRVIGFDRLELLSVMAAGLYLFRREKLMAALTKQDVEVLKAVCSFLAKVVELTCKSNAGSISRCSHGASCSAASVHHFCI